VSDRDPNAPDIRNLRALRPFVRSAARGVAESKIGGKGLKVSLPMRPTRLCNICGCGFDFARTSADIEMKHDTSCKECLASLDDGYTAFVADNRFCFGKSQRLADLAGKIVHVSPETMNSLEGKFKIEQKFKNPKSE
jgi:hypothetical protein